MPIDFKFYGILCCTPPDLEAERLVFESAVAQFVEQVSMPDGVLFAPASLRPPINAAVQKAAIDSNIRTCEFFIQIFGEQWPDPVFEGFVDYALECAADPTMATRQVAVLFRSFPTAPPGTTSFSGAPGGRTTVRTARFQQRGGLSPVTWPTYCPPGITLAEPKGTDNSPWRLPWVASRHDSQPRNFA